MSASITSAARSLSPRTLHLKVYPTPRTFAEQREVLRVIERFGEVSVFKSLKYDPHRPVHNAFLAVYNSASSAKGLEEVSPLRYRIINESPHLPAAQNLEDDTSNSTVFELHASNTSYNHHAFLGSSRMNPLHGPYAPVSHRTSYIAASLSNLVPDSNWSEGLVDWDTERIMWRSDDILAPDEETRTGKDGESISDGWFNARDASRRTEARKPKVMAGLHAMWREGMENKEKKCASMESVEGGNLTKENKKLSD
ncbi:hypothetical protein BKA65DRAFT_254756 [Rhexocercosporidium sp. MPI-PUGE-AT-0058]|nr:hypothetical protein BKA65DRAFT_254756 [Rhexocercosporidium sp. MPI-PUGE-AT-0058]